MSRMRYDRLSRMIKTLWRAIPDINTRIDNIPQTPLKYKGFWDASTNTPDLTAGTFNAGDFFFVSVDGTQDGIDYTLHDEVIFNGTTWDKKPYATSTTESWLYKDLNHDSDLATSSLDLKTVLLPFNISSNVSLKGSTTSSTHDGTNFKFIEGDVIEIKVTFFMELNVTGNAVVIDVFENNQMVCNAMVDTNKQLDTNHTVIFRDIVVTSSMVTNGLDIVVSDIASGGTYIDMYDIYFSITKKGNIL